MAQIDEERVIVRFSSLIRDVDDPNATSIVNDIIRLQIEQFAQELVDPVTVIVETAIETVDANI